MTDGLLIAEKLFLLTHDDESGSSQGTVALPQALAGALLLDLALGQLIRAQDGALVTEPGSPSHPLLADTLDGLAASDRPRSARHWVNRLPRALTPIEERVGRSLVDAGVLRETEHKTLGIFPTTRFVQVDPAPEAALRGQLTEALVEGATPDASTALLVPLLQAMGVVAKVVPKEHRKQAKVAAKQISDAGVLGSAVTKAVGQAVQSVQAAVMMAAVMPIVVGSN